MKKKKLKKRIKKLEKELKIVIRDGREAFDNHRTMISDLSERYVKLREEFNQVEHNRKTDLGIIKDACSKADANRHMIDDIYEKLKILKQRTETDYTQFKPLVDTSKGPDTVSKTCDTCLYNGMGLDGPCMGCTEEDLKMYKSKEDSNE